MKMMEYFFPRDSRHGLAAATTRRIPFLVWMDILLIFYFLAAALMRYRANPGVFGRFVVAVACTEVFFLASLFLVKKGKFRAASYVGGLGPLLNVAWIGFLLPYPIPEDIYRFGLYLLGGLVADSMVALERRQVTVYILSGTALYVLWFFVVIQPTELMRNPETLSIAVTIFLIILSVSLVVLLMARLNHELVELAEAENRQSRARAEALTGLLAGSRTALATGLELQTASEASRDRSREIRLALEGLRSESRELAEDIRGAEAANQGLVQRSRSLKLAVGEESALLGETNEVLGRIASTVTSLAQLAEAEKSTISSVLATSEQQTRDLEGLKLGVERVRLSGANVLEAAGGIGDISENIGLLAMNASIEAAHAGASGKGFSVISQEVRKLAEATKGQIGRIEEALRESSGAAASSAQAVERFGRQTLALSGEVRKTFDALGSILDGLGQVASEASEVDTKAAGLVELARRSGGEVEGSLGGIEAGTGKLVGIRGFSEGLAARIEVLIADFSAIEEALGHAVRTSGRSAEDIAALDRRLASLDTI